MMSACIVGADNVYAGLGYNVCDVGSLGADRGSESCLGICAIA